MTKRALRKSRLRRTQILGPEQWQSAENYGLTRLQRLAGNQAVATLIQRHPGATTFADVGVTQTPSGGGGRQSDAVTPGTDEAVTPGGGTATAVPAGPDYAALAGRLKEAIEGPGTDEAEVFAVLATVGRDSTKLRALREAYVDATGRSLDGDLRGDLSGVELALANALIGDSREERVRRHMRRTPWGVWASTMIDVYGIGVDWEYSGTGSFHRGGNISLNYRTPSRPAALTMIHEVQHAVTFKSGRSADTSMPRAPWVAAKIADEAEAVTKSMESALGMRRAGETATSLGQNAGRMNQFKAAFDTEYDARIAAGEESLAAYTGARTAVRDGLVTGWFSDGTFRTSTSGTAALTYQQHYENEWDRLNAVGTGTGS